MKLDGISAAISPPIPQPKTTPKPPETGPEVTREKDGGGKANGVVSKLNEGGHFNAVADVRLRIAHFDNADLEKIDPALLPAPEDVPGKAYEKFLEQYRALYNASLPTAKPEEPAPETPAPVDEEPVVEAPPISEEPPATDPIIVTPPETEPVAIIPDPTVDGSSNIFAAFEEFLQPQTEETPGILDIAI